MARKTRIGIQSVLNVARDVFLEDGYGASTKKIARRAGISESLLFVRHHSKQALFFAAMMPPPFALPDQQRDLDMPALAVEVLRYFRHAGPMLMQLVTHPAFDLSRISEEDNPLPMRAIMSAIRRALAGAQAKTAQRADNNIGAAVVALLAILYGLAQLERMGLSKGHFPDSFVRQVVDLIT